MSSKTKIFGNLCSVTCSRHRAAWRALIDKAASLFGTYDNSNLRLAAKSRYFMDSSIWYVHQKRFSVWVWPAAKRAGGGGAGGEAGRTHTEKRSDVRIICAVQKVPGLPGCWPYNALCRASIELAMVQSQHKIERYNHPFLESHRWTPLPIRPHFFYMYILIGFMSLMVWIRL